MEKESILNGKKILTVDDEQDVLEVLKEEITSEAPDCSIDSATNYRQAVELLASYTYDLAIFDVMGVRGFDLLELAVDRPYPIPVVILTGKALSPQSLKDSISKGARAFLPKEHLGSLVPFLEDVLTFEYGAVWKRILKQIEGLFNEGWGPYWRKPDESFWKEFDKKINSK
jgi:CheY-like chemotaxis protein